MDYMILHNANMFIVEANISRYLNGPSDQTGSHAIVLKCKKDLIIHLKPFNGNSFPLVAPQFIINIHEYANEINFQIGPLRQYICHMVHY